ncbi:hypothetical protein AB3U99_21325 [Niallia sp. JL1B1071]|uniref:hypothetical protein n=1 Tax=Niallia tiangongensis TaxID=3237105 RepID=UPI0037DD302B
MAEGINDFDVVLPSVFPTHLVREDSEKCKRILYELHDYSRDYYQHQLTSLHKNALYKLIEWSYDENYPYIDIFDLKPVTEDDLSILLDLRDLKYYSEIIFDDFDFLNIDLFSQLFFTSPHSLISLGVDLDEYLDLMPVDIRKRYRKENDTVNDNSRELEEYIIELICYSIDQMELDTRRLLNLNEHN